MSAACAAGCDRNTWTSNRSGHAAAHKARREPLFPAACLVRPIWCRYERRTTRGGSCRGRGCRLATLGFGAEGRNRTGTGLAAQGILSPLRLPVPPPPHNKIEKFPLLRRHGNRRRCRHAFLSECSTKCSGHRNKEGPPPDENTRHRRPAVASRTWIWSFRSDFRGDYGRRCVIFGLTVRCWAKMYAVPRGGSNANRAQPACGAVGRFRDGDDRCGHLRSAAG